MTGGKWRKTKETQLNPSQEQVANNQHRVGIELGEVKGGCPKISNRSQIVTLSAKP